MRGEGGEKRNIGALVNLIALAEYYTITGQFSGVG